MAMHCKLQLTAHSVHDQQSCSTGSLYNGPSTAAGALVLSTGDASYAALLTNSVDDDGFGRATGVISTDPDMNAASTAAGYTQNLLDQVLLTFDLTPTISGNLAFQYVFGSEEYPEFVPTPGEQACMFG